MGFVANFMRFPAVE